MIIGVRFFEQEGGEEGLNLYALSQDKKADPRIWKSEKSRIILLQPATYFEV